MISDDTVPGGTGNDDDGDGEFIEIPEDTAPGARDTAPGAGARPPKEPSQ